MIPFGTETVTLFHRVVTADQSGKHHASYSKSTLHNCSWRVQDTTRLDNGTIVQADSITCRIPVSQTRPSVGDLLIYGEYSGSITSAADIEAVVEAYRNSRGAFAVRTVTDNNVGKIPLKHYKASGW